jgi:hypothetical protein
MPAINYEYKYRVAKDRIKWLEDGLKEILDCCDLKNTFILSSDDAAFVGDVKDIAQSSLDGEPTTADEYNAKTKLELEKVNKGLNVLTSGMDALAKDKKYVRISDVNKEIAKEWNLPIDLNNKEREEKIDKINKRKNKDGV